MTEVGAAISGVLIYNNIIRRFALNQDYGHVSGLQLNPGTVGRVYGNQIISEQSLSVTGILYSGGKGIKQN